jgi:hypothetical protein
MERHAMRDEAQLVCVDEHIDGHLRNAAELARQRPFGAFAVGQDAAEHASARCSTGDLLDFLVAVDGKQRHAERVGAGDVAFFLDGVAIGHTVGSRAGLQRHLDFGDGRAIEVGTQAGQQPQDFRRRIGLHRIEDAAVGQRLAEGLEIVANHVEVNDQARGSGRRVRGNRGCVQSSSGAPFPALSGHIRQSICGHLPVPAFGGGRSANAGPSMNHAKISDRWSGS